MKTVRFIAVYALLTVVLNIVAQSNGELRDYRRNTLVTMMIYHSEDEFGYNIFQAFEDIPTPDKYDGVNIGVSVLYNDSLYVDGSKTYGLNKAEYGNSLSSSEVKRNAQAILEALNRSQCAKRLVAQWFNLRGNSVETAVFSTDTIAKRGQYNASDVDVELAQQTARGVAMLADAGEELLNNTFILVNDVTYVTSEQKAASAKVAMSIIGGLLDAVTGSELGSSIATVSGTIADSFTGFNVKTHSYLYQLVWNDSVAAVFYNNYYTDKPNADKISAFLADNSLFQLKYVAHEFEYDSKTTQKGKYDREELVKMVCVRSMDKNIAALQLAYEDFKVKVPVYSVITNEKGKNIGYTAKIGLKEGITETSTFQVIQRQIDPKTNRTKYKYVATLKPEHGKIWDNRYNAVLEHDSGATLPYTTFKKVSGGEILPGMLIVEGKYSKAKE